MKIVALLNALGDDYHSLADFDTQAKRVSLVKILTYHVLVGTAAYSTELIDEQEIPTLQGENVRISLKDGPVHIIDATDTNATVIDPDLEASNRVII